MTRQICITDSDFLISIIKGDDKNHELSLAITKKLISEEARILYPVSAIVEAATALSRRYNLPKLAQDLLKSYRDPGMEIIGVAPEDFINSIDFFNPKATKQDTPFDSLILSLAFLQKADIVLSYDGFYKGKGFKLAKDLLKI
jgi:predicted nucleic acid-binding protein